MGFMTDREALDFLVARFGQKVDAAAALGVSQQRFNNWYERGISATKRSAVWAMINDHGGHLAREWLLERAA